MCIVFYTIPSCCDNALLLCKKSHKDFISLLCKAYKREKMKLQNFHFRLVLTPEVMAECVEVIDNKNATEGQV